MILAGAAVILLGLLRYHPTPDALGVFIISLLVFGLFTSGTYSSASGNQTFSFTRARYGSIKSLSMSVSESFGSVDVSFVNDPNLLLNLTYSQPSVVFPFFTRSPTMTSLQASSSTGSVDINAHYLGLPSNSTLEASSSTGSVRLEITLNPGVGCYLSASSNTGSATPSLSSAFHTLKETNKLLQARSSNYSSASHSVSVSLSSSTGSIDVTAQ